MEYSHKVDCEVSERWVIVNGTVGEPVAQVNCDRAVRIEDLGVLLSLRRKEEEEAKRDGGWRWPCVICRTRLGWATGGSRLDPECLPALSDVNCEIANFT